MHKHIFMERRSLHKVGFGGHLLSLTFGFIKKSGAVQRIDQFRIYYNHTIHPELMRMERLRIRLLRLLALSAFLLFCLLLLEFYAGEIVIVLALAIPITIYMIFLWFRVRKFVKTFKPRVVQLVLDFISEAPNMGQLDYQPEGYISKEIFFNSRLFATGAPVYLGEDLIYGRVGEMDFQLSELRVQDFSPVRNRLDPVFNGIFLQAVFPEETSGEIVIWPRSQRQYLSKAVRNFTMEGGVKADHEILNERFRETFMTYATTSKTHVIGILSDPMQEAIVHYREFTGKDIYLSFIENNICLAITESRDMLEPYIFRSNISFDLVRSFYEDIQLLLQIVEDFDKTH